MASLAEEDLPSDAIVLVTDRRTPRLPYSLEENWPVQRPGSIIGARLSFVPL